MKLIKLDRRHKLKRTAGYDWAFVFNENSSVFYRVGLAVENIEGHCPYRSFISTLYGLRKNNIRENCNDLFNSLFGVDRNKRRHCYYVGLRQESTATLIMLTGTAEE
jgi:hypothetical protein